MGSPPRVRGKVKFKENGGKQVRITPACAGKRDDTKRAGTCPGDHPRVCGEKQSLPSGATRPTGSPPRVRGKAACDLKVRSPAGITPACAGKRRTAQLICCAQWDHPRVCGEKGPFGAARSMSKGSPPRVRGKENQNATAALYSRITPACAGKSPHPRWTRRRGRDHPRVCGEKK